MPKQTIIYTCEICGSSFIQEQLAVTCEEKCKRNKEETSTYIAYLDAELLKHFKAHALRQVQLPEFAPAVEFAKNKHWNDLWIFVTKNIIFDPEFSGKVSELVMNDAWDECSQKVCELAGVDTPDFFQEVG